MKIGKLLLTGVIALGLMACNNEEGPDVTVEKDATISIKVFPSSKSPAVRAVGDLTGDGVLPEGLAAESVIKQLEVWIFKGDVLDGYGSAIGTEVTDIQAHKGNSAVVVAANVGIGNTVTSKAGLLAKLEGLPTDVANEGLIMTAEPIDVTLTAGNNYYGYTDAEVDAKTGEKKNHLTDGKVPLAITRVNARVAIISAEVDYDEVPATQKLVFDALGDVEVAMFNVPNQTKLFGTSLAVTSGQGFKWSYGAQWPSPSGTYIGWNDNPADALPLLTDEIEEGEDWVLIETENAPYYYVNECVADKMFIVLRAKVYKDDNVVTELKDLYTDEEGYTYYPVWVNKDGLQTAGAVTRNTQYNISLTIKGLGNPTIDPLEKAWLDVKVVVEEWAVVNQNVTW